MTQHGGTPVRPVKGDGAERFMGLVARVFARGFGFIRCAQLDPEDKGIYFHASDLQERGVFAELRAGAGVEFGIMEDDKGLRATGVVVLEQGTGELPRVVAEAGDRPRAPRGRVGGRGERSHEGDRWRGAGGRGRGGHRG